MTTDFIGIAPEDPIRAVWAWRSDSMTLARLQPVLERLRLIPDLPCTFGEVPYMCARQHNNRLCRNCAIRDIRAALFGEQPEENDGPAIPPTDETVGANPRPDERGPAAASPDPGDGQAPADGE